eukprot:scaffold291310_cov31-Tisochrysis_lutea.AAC.11
MATSRRGRPPAALASTATSCASVAPSDAPTRSNDCCPSTATSSAASASRPRWRSARTSRDGKPSACSRSKPISLPKIECTRSSLGSCSWPAAAARTRTSLGPSRTASSARTRFASVRTVLTAPRSSGVSSTPANARTRCATSIAARESTPSSTRSVSGSTSMPAASRTHAMACSSEKARSSGAASRTAAAAPPRSAMSSRRQSNWVRLYAKGRAEAAHHASRGVASSSACATSTAARARALDQGTEVRGQGGGIAAERRAHVGIRDTQLRIWLDARVPQANGEPEHPDRARSGLGVTKAGLHRAYDEWGAGASALPAQQRHANCARLDGIAKRRAVGRRLVHGQPVVRHCRVRNEAGAFALLPHAAAQRPACCFVGGRTQGGGAAGLGPHISIGAFVKAVTAAEGGREPRVGEGKTHRREQHEGNGGCKCVFAFTPLHGADCDVARRQRR